MRRLWHRITLMITRSYARGVWMPLLCALCICLISLGVVVLINNLISSDISLGRILELMLDPGSFDAAEETATFQLIITLVGAVVFTSLLITTVSNIFSNRAEAFRNGEFDVDMKYHTVVLGTNQIFYNSLEFLYGYTSILHSVVVLTTEPVKEVRSKIASYIGHDKADRFLIVSGDRRFLYNLERVSFNKATTLYILGEENEPDHDAANISCFKALCSAKERHCDCYIQIDSKEVLSLFIETRSEEYTGLQYFNPSELLAKTLLINDKIEQGLSLKYLEPYDEFSHHMIVIGSSSIATEIANLYLRIAHYPNYVVNHIKSKITIIDDNPSLELGLNSNLKNACHFYEYGNGNCPNNSFNGDEYDDILDFEITHISGKISDKHVRDLLESYKDTNDRLHIVIAANDTDQNFKDSISLPLYVYEQNVPVYVYQPITGLVIDKHRLPEYYNNLQQFGMKVSLADIDAYHKYDLIFAADILEGILYYEKTDDDPCLPKYLDSSLIPYVHYLVNENRHMLDANVHFGRCLHNCWVSSKMLAGYRMPIRKHIEEFRKIEPALPIYKKNSPTCRRELMNMRDYEKLEKVVAFPHISERLEHAYRKLIHKDCN